MSQTVTFETAKRLKEAGFPQPEFAVGQYWYDIDGEAFWVKCDASPHIHGEWVGDDHSGFVEIPHGEEVFAPTATDIIREFERLQKSKWIRLGMSRDGYECYLYAFGGIRDSFCHENPAEACAEAWLKHKE